jgi:hypothetical protein
MKRILTLSIALSILVTSFAAGTTIVVPKKPSPNANKIFIPVGKNGEKISLMDLSRMKVKDLEAITGGKMKLKDKLGFAIAQKQLRNSINADGTINNNRLAKAAGKAAGTSGFNLGGFALGFLLGLIGVLIAYLIKGDEHAARVKWAWIGFGVGVVLWLLVLVL